MNPSRRYRLSPTLLTLFIQCPRCFWLLCNRGWKRAQGPAPGLPIALDTLIKQHLDEYRQRNELPPELRAHFESTAKLFPDQECLAMWRDGLRGIRWVHPSGNELKGAVDDLLMRGETLVIIDIKTRAEFLREGAEEWFQLQLNSYALLLERAGYTVARTAFLIVWVPKAVTSSSSVEFQVQVVPVSVEPEQALMVFEAALECLQSDAPTRCCVHCKRISLLVYGGAS